MTVDEATPPSRPPQEVSFLQIWYLALIRPSEDAYQAISSDSTASVSRAIIWLALTGLASSTLTLIARFGQLGNLIAEYSDRLDVGTLAIGSASVLLCLIPVLTIIGVVGLVVYAGIIQFVGGAFGGQARFDELFYMLATISAPMALINAALGVIPLVGGCLALPVGAYSTYLTALAVKSVHRFSWAKTVFTLLVPVILTVLIFLILFAALVLPLIQQLLQSGAGI